MRALPAFMPQGRFMPLRQTQTPNPSWLAPPDADNIRYVKLALETALSCSTPLSSGAAPRAHLPIFARAISRFEPRRFERTG